MTSSEVVPACRASSGNLPRLWRRYSKVFCGLGKLSAWKIELRRQSNQTMHALGQGFVFIALLRSSHVFFMYWAIRWPQAAHGRSGGAFFQAETTSLRREDHGHRKGFKTLEFLPKNAKRGISRENHSMKFGG
jgi:hypothetical protein